MLFTDTTLPWKVLRERQMPLLRWCHTSLDSCLNSSTDRQDSLSFKELFLLQLNNDNWKVELEEVSRLLCSQTTVSFSVIQATHFRHEETEAQCVQETSSTSLSSLMAGSRIYSPEHPTCSKCSIKIYWIKIHPQSSVVPSFISMTDSYLLHMSVTRNNSDILSQ